VSPLTPTYRHRLAYVAFLVPGVRVSLRASRPEFRCDEGAPPPAQLRAWRCKLGLTTAKAAALLGVTQWTLGMWENGRQRPQARYRDAIALLLKRAPWC
jgi:DNA-binding XRE family transcriptional regulator